MRHVAGRALAQNKTAGLTAVVWRQSVPVVIVIAIAWTLRERIYALDFGGIQHSVHAVEPYQWALAAAATAISFWAIGRYDETVHGLLQTRVGASAARKGGATAVAISQFAGFGALSASLVRWRMLDAVSLVTALRISAVVTLSFLLGWAFVTSSAAAISGGTALVPMGLALAMVAVGLGTLLAPSFIANLPRVFPTTAAMLKIILLVSLDIGGAALALYVLLPPGTEIAAVGFFVAFSVALVAGLASGAPGGIGAFELLLLMQLPGIAPEPLLASAIAFRLVYHLMPAAVAGAALISGPTPSRGRPPSTIMPPIPPYLPPDLDRTLWRAPFAEAKLMRQGEFGLMQCGCRPQAAVAQLGQSLAMLTGPLSARDEGPNFLQEFQDMAHARSRAALIYKATPRLAALARAAGWRVLPVAHEALVATPEFSAEGPARRQLRRMLRKAQAAGVQITEAGRDLPLAQMADISAKWVANNGVERRLSMGRFDGGYVGHQRVFLASLDSDIIGFVTFHETRDQWALDLMRQTADAPPGTMHTLVYQAIRAARDLNVAHVSLAAAQWDEHHGGPVMQRLAEVCGRSTNAAGLRRFKTSFAPSWQPRYLLAPSRGELILGLWDLTIHIRAIAMPWRRWRRASYMKTSHDDH